LARMAAFMSSVMRSFRFMPDLRLADYRPRSCV
jgi:hypothetical protein